MASTDGAGTDEERTEAPLDEAPDAGAPDAAVSDRSGPTPRRAAPITKGFLVGLALIVVLGAGVRLTYVFAFKQDHAACSDRTFLQRYGFPPVSPDGKYWAPDNICGDAGYYNLGANLLADGKGYIVPFRYLFEGRGEYPAADHPPLYMTYLSLYSMVGLKSVLSHQLASVFLGLLSIVLVGLVGRRLAGERAGLVAAALCAFYVYIWVNDGLVMSETLVITLTAAVFLCALRYQERPSWWRLAAIGVVVGLAALTRAELILILPVVVPFVIWSTCRRDPDRWRALVLRCLAAGAVVALVMAPWVVRNLLTFEKPVLVSTNLGITLKYANCDPTYYGDIRGYWDFNCLAQVPDAADQSLQEELMRQAAMDYITNNKRAIPRVVVTRVLRQWNLYKPMQQTYLDQVIEDRERPLNKVALGEYYVLSVAAIGGAVVLVRRRGWLTSWIVLSPFAIVTLTSAITYGTTRFRAPAEVSIVLLAAIAVDAVVAALIARRRRRTTGPSDDDRVPATV